MIETVEEVLGEVLAKPESYESRLERLGFKNASDIIVKAKGIKRKLTIAYEHYRFVTQEKIDAFNLKLREQGSSRRWQMLSFTPMEIYEKAPPENVLQALEEAHRQKCFDSFEVAHIIDVEDPILFGRINECPDRFFISQWDDDVKIEDLIKENEG